MDKSRKKLIFEVINQLKNSLNEKQSSCSIRNHVGKIFEV